MKADNVYEDSNYRNIHVSSPCPLFSFIIPTFNSGGTLQNTLGSLSLQRCRNFEVIIVDGASTDNTLNLVERFSQSEKDIGIIVISEIDNGIYDAMNKGIKLSSGKYIYFLGSDDRLYDETTLEKVSLFIDEHPGADIVYGDIVFTGDKTGNASKREGAIRNRIAYLKILDKIGVFLRLNISHQAMFARREILTDGFSLRYRLAADYDWYLKQKEEGRRFKHTGENIACFNVSGASSDLKPLVSEISVISARHFGKLFYRRKPPGKRMHDHSPAVV